MDILTKMKDVMFWLNQVSSDELPNLQANFLNRGKNELQDLISDGEARMWAKMDKDRGDPIG